MEGKCYFMAHKAWMMVLLGVLILINIFWVNISWAMFIGIIAIIFGILVLIFHGCCCKNCTCGQEASPIKKK